MKYVLVGCGLLLLGSLPVRGAWIEMMICDDFSDYFLSLPVRGAWIEMRAAYPLVYCPRRRSP